jgi:hypothetical protein
VQLCRIETRSAPLCAYARPQKNTKAELNAMLAEAVAGPRRATRAEALG